MVKYLFKHMSSGRGKFGQCGVNMP